MKKSEGNTNHHMGKITGYELIDGEYHIAPLYRERFAKIALKRQGLREMLNMVTKHTAVDLEILIEEAQIVWDDLADDIGINLSDGWEYLNGKIRAIGMIVVYLWWR